jgi:hypothetical protein
LDKKLDRVQGVKGAKEESDRRIEHVDQETHDGKGIGGTEVSTEEEESGFPGPSRLNR